MTTLIPVPEGDHNSNKSLASSCKENLASSLQSRFMASSHRLTTVQQLWDQLEARPRIHVEGLAAAVVALQLLQLVVHHARSSRAAASHWSLRCAAWASYYLPVPLAAIAVAVMLRFPCPCWLVAVFFAAGQADTMAAYSLRDAEMQSARCFATRGLSLAYVALALFHADGGGAVARVYLMLRPKDIFFLVMGFHVVRHGLKVSATAMIPPSEICKVVTDHVRFRARSPPSTVVGDDDDDDNDDHQPPQQVQKPSVVAVGSLDSYQSAVSGCTTLEDIEKNVPGASRRRSPTRLLRHGNASLSSALFLQLLQRYAYHGGAPLQCSSANHAFRDVVAAVPFGLGWKAALKVVNLQLRFLHDYFFSVHGSPSSTAYNLYRDYAFFKIGFLLTVIGLVTDDDDEQFDATCTAIGLCLPLFLIEVCHFIGVAISDRIVVSHMCEIKKDLGGLLGMARGASTDVVGAKLGLVLERLGLNKVHLGQYSLVEEFDYYYCSYSLKQRLVMGTRRRPPPEHGTPSSEDWSWQFEQLQKWICEKAESSSAASSRFAFDDGASSSMFVVRVREARGPAVDAAALPWWALRHKTRIHTILVWHVAAWFCDMSEHDKRCLRYREPRTIVPPENRMFTMMLSNYCAYLVAFRPELLGGEHPAMTASVFHAAVKEAAALGLGGLPTLSQRHAKMVISLKKLQEAPGDDEDAGVVRQGVKLGGQLMARGDASYESYMELWDLMVDFWGEMVLHVARPGGDAAAHVECLADGGEFVTQLWALLSNGRWEEGDSSDDGAKTTTMVNASSGTMIHFKLRASE